MSYKHGKAKILGTLTDKFGTRKSWRCVKGNIILPRVKGEWRRMTDSKRSGRRKWLERMSNRKVRKTLELGSGMSYKKVYNLKWELD